MVAPLLEGPVQQQRFVCGMHGRAVDVIRMAPTELLLHIRPLCIHHSDALKVVLVVRTERQTGARHRRDGPTVELEEGEGDIARAPLAGYDHVLAIKLPRLLVVDMQAAQAGGAVRAAADNAADMLLLHCAEARDLVVCSVNRDEAIRVARHRAVKVPIDATKARVTPGVSRGIDPAGAFKAHRAHRVEAAVEHRRPPIIDRGHARDPEVLVVLRRPDAQAAPGPRLRAVEVADEDEVRVEGRCVQAVGEVVHEVSGATLHEAVVLVADVASAVVEHPGVAAEGREAHEGVQLGRCVGRLQVPAEAARVGRVVEELEPGLRRPDAGQSLQAPAPRAVHRHVRLVPAREAWHPEARRRLVVLEQDVVGLGAHHQVVLEQWVVLVAGLRKVAVPQRAVRHIVADDAVVRPVHHHRSLEGVVVSVVSQVGLIHHVHSPPRRQVVPMGGIAAKVSRLSCSGELRVLDPHFAAEHRCHVRAEHIGISGPQGGLVALDLHVPLQETHGGAQVHGVGDVGVVVPLAQVLMHKGLVELDDEPALVQALDVANLLFVPAMRLRDEDAHAQRPINGFLEAYLRRARGHSLHEPGPRNAGPPVQVQLPDRAHVAWRGALARVPERLGVATPVQAAEVRDRDHLRAHERQLQGVPTVTVQSDRRLVHEGRLLGADHEVAASDPDVGGVEHEVAAIKLQEPAHQDEEEPWGVLVEEDGLALGHDDGIPVNGRLGICPTVDVAPPIDVLEGGVLGATIDQREAAAEHPNACRRRRDRGALACEARDGRLVHALHFAGVAIELHRDRGGRRGPRERCAAGGQGIEVRADDLDERLAPGGASVGRHEVHDGRPVHGVLQHCMHRDLHAGHARQRVRHSAELDGAIGGVPEVQQDALEARAPHEGARALASVG
mmetsp:Transcript_50958/g.148389  ORF Transcript_50958/g.148389 Transcript_50958/m.148389 type:complete len:896 (-) Transcript_50958:333-3020(-)